MKIRNRIKGLALVDVARIRPNPANWRIHGDHQRDVLRGVLADVGVVSAVLLRVIDADARLALAAVDRGDADAFASWLVGYDGDYMLVDGHLRVEELQQHDGRIEALILDLDEPEAAEVLATFDPVGDLAGFDAAAFEANLAEFETSNPAVQELLADLAEADRRMREDAEAALGNDSGGGGAAEDDDGAGTGDETKDGAGEETAVDPTDAILEKWAALGCCEGSLWEVPSASGGGVHRVLCGDASDPLAVVHLMNGQRAKLGQHDPPYGIAIVSHSGSTLADGRAIGQTTGDGKYKKARRGNFRPIVGDASAFDAPHLIDSADRVVLWGANNFPSSLPPSNTWIVWDKKATADGGAVASNSFSDAELAFVSPTAGEIGHTRIIRHLWSGLIRASEKGEKRLAPTQKPIVVISQPIEWWTEPGDIVTDWYCGSGTVAVAAEKLGRVAYVMEITPRYTAVTLERLARIGLTPRLVEPS